MTEAEIRTMLENYRTDSANLEWWFEHKGVETDAEFYEGEQSGAVDYAKDKIQSSGEIDGGAVGLICKRARKIEQDEPDELIDMMRADFERLRNLERAVYKLPSLERSIIVSRYFEGNSMRNAKEEFHYQKARIVELTSRAIQLLAERL